MTFDSYSENNVKRRFYFIYNCYIETHLSHEMDTSKKDAPSKVADNVKYEEDLNLESDQEMESINYDLNILYESFTYLCTTAHLEPLLKSAWWINTNWQRNQGIASGQQIPSTSSGIPSTSSTIMPVDHTMPKTRRLKPAVTVTPSLKRQKTAVGRTEIPAKRRRLTNE